jgi:hypothetical protein
LRSADFVITRAADRPWALTPDGRRRSSELLGDVDYEKIVAELAGTPGVDYAHARHSVIPPTFAPPRWQAGISRLLERFPFETNLFCMTRFPKSTLGGLPDPIQRIIDVIRIVADLHGLTLHLASDRQIEDDLLGNVGAYMWACQYGIGLLENRSPNGSRLNSNMLIELGSMLIMGRRCAILKDRTSPAPPSDLSGQIYKSVNFDCIEDTARAVHEWLAEDLALGRCPQCETRTTTLPES